MFPAGAATTGMKRIRHAEMETEMTETKIVNGVDLNALTDTIRAIKAEPELAAFKFGLENEWAGGGANVSRIDAYSGACQHFRREQPFEVRNDEPPVLLSGDTGPNPVENLLHALAGCLTTSLVYHAAAKGMKVDAVRTRFEGDIDLHGFLGLDDGVRNGYQQVRVAFDIEGDLDEAQKEYLMQVAQERSPVFDSIANGVTVECRLAQHEELVANAA